MSYLNQRRGVPAWLVLLVLIALLATLFAWFCAIYSVPPGAAAAKGDMSVVWRGKGEPLYTVAAAPVPADRVITHLPHQNWADTTAAKVKSWVG